MVLINSTIVVNELFDLPRVIMKKLNLFLCVFLFSVTAQADLKQDGAKLCQKIKSCAVIEIDKQPISPDEKAAILNIFDTQCVQSVQKYETDLGSAGLEGKAKACLASLTNLSCTELTAGTGPVKTPTCTDFENSAKEAGIDLSR